MVALFAVFLVFSVSFQELDSKNKKIEELKAKQPIEATARAE